MKECMITNLGSMAFGSIAIIVACAVTKSAFPLWAFLLIPKWRYSSPTNEEVQNEKTEA